MQPHEVFTRDGDNLEMMLTIPMTAAALGCKVPIRPLSPNWPMPTPRSPLWNSPFQPAPNRGADCDQGVAASAKLRGRDGKQRGDLGVTIVVQTPTKLDESQRKLLEELADARGEVGDGIAKTH